MSNKENESLDELAESFNHILENKYKKMTYHELKKEADKMKFKLFGFSAESLSKNRNHWVSQMIVKELEMIIAETKICCELKNMTADLELMCKSTVNQEKTLSRIFQNYIKIHPRVLRETGLIPMVRKIKIKSKFKRNADLASKILIGWKKQVDAVVKECG
jgi:Ca2+-dependent lipid-binding protein